MSELGDLSQTLMRFPRIALQPDEMKDAGLSVGCLKTTPPATRFIKGRNPLLEIFPLRLDRMSLLIDLILVSLIGLIMDSRGGTALAGYESQASIIAGKLIEVSTFSIEYCLARARGQEHTLNYNIVVIQQVSEHLKRVQSVGQKDPDLKWYVIYRPTIAGIVVVLEL